MTMLSRSIPSTVPTLSTAEARYPPTRPPTMPRTIMPSRPSREPMTWLARKPAMAPTTIHETMPIEVPPLPGSDRLAAEDRDGPVHDDLENRPADEGSDRGDVEGRAGRVECVGSKDPLEREDKQLADVEDGRDKAVCLSGVEQEQDDPEPDDDLDEAEDEDDDSPCRLGAAGLCLPCMVALGPNGLLTGRGWRLGDDRLVD